MHVFASLSNSVQWLCGLSHPSERDQSLYSIFSKALNDTVKTVLSIKKPDTVEDFLAKLKTAEYAYVEKKNGTFYLFHYCDGTVRAIDQRNKEVKTDNLKKLYTHFDTVDFTRIQYRFRGDRLQKLKQHLGIQTDDALQDLRLMSDYLFSTAPNEENFFSKKSTKMFVGYLLIFAPLADALRNFHSPTIRHVHPSFDANPAILDIALSLGIATQLQRHPFLAQAGLASLFAPTVNALVDTFGRTGFPFELALNGTDIFPGVPGKQLRIQQESGQPLPEWIRLETDHKVIGTLNLTDGYQLVKKGTNVVIADGFAGVKAVGIENVQAPTLKSAFPVPFAKAIASGKGDTVFVSGLRNVTALNYADPFNPYEEWAIDLPTDEITTIGYHNGTLLVAQEEEGDLWFYDVTGPSPEMKSQLSLNRILSLLFDQSGNAHVIDRDKGYHIINFQNVTGPIDTLALDVDRGVGLSLGDQQTFISYTIPPVIRSYNGTYFQEREVDVTTTTALQAHGNRIYGANSESGFLTIDTQLNILGSKSLGANTRGFVIDGDYALVVSHNRFDILHLAETSGVLKGFPPQAMHIPARLNFLSSNDTVLSSTTFRMAFDDPPRIISEILTQQATPGKKFEQTLRPSNFFSSSETLQLQFRNLPFWLSYSFEMKQVGQIQGTGNTQRLDAHKSTVVAIDFGKKVHVFDFSNVDFPRNVTSFDMDARDLFIDREAERFYVAAGFEATHGVDLNSGNILFTLPGIHVNSVYAKNNRLLTGSTNKKFVPTRGLALWDVNDPSNVQQLDEVGGVGVSAILVSEDGKTAYTSGENQLNIFDISGDTISFLKMLPINVGIEPEVNGHAKMALKDSALFLAEKKLGIKIVNVEDPANPLVDKTLPHSIVTSVWVEGQTLFASLGGGGIIAYDVTNPFNPLPISTFNFGGETSQAAASQIVTNGQNVAFAGTPQGIVFALDVNTSDLIWRLTGTPDVGDITNLNIDLAAITRLGTEEVLPYTLKVLGPPVRNTAVPISDTTALIGTTTEIVVDTNAFIEPNGDPVTLSATLADDSPLPPFIIFDVSIGRFRITPTSSDVGTYTIKLKASNAKGQAEETFTIQTNHAPNAVSTIPDIVVREGTALNHILPVIFVDPDGNSINITALLHPDWATFHPEGTGRLTSDPTASFLIGEHRVLLEGSDGMGGTTQAVQRVLVEEEFAPQVVNPPATMTIKVGQRIRIHLPSYFTERNGDPLFFSTEGVPGWLKRVGDDLEGKPKHTKDFGPKTYNLAATASDGKGNATLTWDISVSGQSDWELTYEILRILIPLLVGGFAYYKGRGYITNIKHRRKIKPQEHLMKTTARDFSHMLKTPTHEVDDYQAYPGKKSREEIAKDIQNKVAKWWEIFKSRKIPGGDRLPTWIRYNNENNSFEFNPTFVGQVKPGELIIHVFSHGHVLKEIIHIDIYEESEHAVRRRHRSGKDHEMVELNP